MHVLFHGLHRDLLSQKYSVIQVHLSQEVSFGPRWQSVTPPVLWRLPLSRHISHCDNTSVTV